MKNVPEKIFLVVHGVDKDELSEAELNCDYNEDQHYDALTWCDIRQFDTDEEYIHISEYNKLVKENEHLKYMAKDDDIPF